MSYNMAVRLLAALTYLSFSGCVFNVEGTVDVKFQQDPV